jgi:hypothetical protein
MITSQNNILFPKVEKQRNQIFEINRQIDDKDLTHVVIQCFDLFQNFLFKSVVKKSEILSITSDTEFTNYIKQLIIENELNTEGIYSVELFFVNDEFESFDNEKNRFIVTEISSDRTELRLNPKSNDQKFIDKFNLFKQYYYINQPEPLKEFEIFIDEFLTSYLTNFYQQIEGAFVNNIIFALFESDEIEIKRFINSTVPNSDDSLSDLENKISISEFTNKILLQFDEVLNASSVEVRNDLFNTITSNQSIRSLHNTYINAVNNEESQSSINEKRKALFELISSTISANIITFITSKFSAKNILNDISTNCRRN